MRFPQSTARRYPLARRFLKALRPLRGKVTRAGGRASRFVFGLLFM
jgi:hypothetical protein